MAVSLWNVVNDANHRSISVGRTHFARKCMYEKLTKCAAKITRCIFKR